MINAGSPAPPGSADAIAWWAEMVGVDIDHDRLPGVATYLDEVRRAVATLDEFELVDVDSFESFDPAWVEVEG